MGWGAGALAPAEQSFLNQLRSTLIIAALAAGGLGILLGVAISWSLAAPLASVARAARAFANHKWDQRVNVGGAATREVAEVANAVNAMADSLQQAETLRRQLMADIAHELRTPLTVLQGNLRALLDGVYPLELGEIATLYDETRLLNRLVDDLRELSLAEAGQLQLNLRATDIRALLQTAAASFMPVAEAQAVSLALEATDTMPLATSDPDRLAQVVRNLLSNALRHTPGGGNVTLSASAEKKMIRVVVADTGDGIPAEELPRVFDRFYRGDMSRARARGGSGLGLAIAKTWVMALGGEIGVESAPDQGSRFWFTVPVAT
jgi:two-component system OmpR family sensor kinase/two-component system sensor histidine kinase BaeS